MICPTLAACTATWLSDISLFKNVINKIHLTASELGITLHQHQS